MNSNVAKLLIFLFSAPAAAEISFFDSSINYWDQKESVEAEQVPLPKSSKAQKNSKFQWGKYMDPKNKEFFKEGDYTPPEPFMELARDPSDENIKMWFAYLKKKNQLSERLQKRIADYQGTHASTTVKEQLIAAVPKPVVSTIDPRRYRLRMYFDSKCPHCKRMFATLAALQKEGFFVEALQIDDRKMSRSRYPVAVQRASKEDVAKYKIQSVPLLLVGDLKQKRVLKLTGYLTPKALIEKLRLQESTDMEGFKS